MSSKRRACTKSFGSAWVSAQCLAARSRKPPTALTVCRKVGTLRSYSDVAIGFLLLEPASPGRTLCCCGVQDQYTRHRRSRFGHADRLSPGSVNVREGSMAPARETWGRMSERDTHCMLVDDGGITCLEQRWV